MSPNDQEKVDHHLGHGSRVEMSEKHHGSLIDALMLVCQYSMNCFQSPLQFYKGQLLNTELLGKSECQSTSDVDVGGAEFSGSDVLR